MATYLSSQVKSLSLQNIDEISILDEFFTAQVQSGATSCEQITALFDVQDAANGGTRLNTIFAQLPSYINPDFVGMDKSLNGLKGSVSAS